MNYQNSKPRLGKSNSKRSYVRGCSARGPDRALCWVARGQCRAGHQRTPSGPALRVWVGPSGLPPLGLGLPRAQLGFAWTRGARAKLHLDDEVRTALAASPVSTSDVWTGPHRCVLLTSDVWTGARALPRLTPNVWTGPHPLPPPDVRCMDGRSRAAPPDTECMDGGSRAASPDVRCMDGRSRAASASHQVYGRGLAARAAAR